MNEELTFFTALTMSGLLVYVAHLRYELRKKQKLLESMVRTMIESTPEELMESQKLFRDIKHEIENNS